MWGKFFGNLIIKEIYKYEVVIVKRPDLKDAIDKYLSNVERSDLIIK